MRRRRTLEVSVGSQPVAVSVEQSERSTRMKPTAVGGLTQRVSEPQFSEHRPPCARPLVFTHDVTAVEAIRVMEAAGQALAFTSRRGELSGVVSGEDLLFALDWGGRAATVGAALTVGVVEVGQESDVRVATNAYCDALRCWVASHDEMAARERAMALAGKAGPPAS